jgi:hypothetical protein
MILTDLHPIPGTVFGEKVSCDDLLVLHLKHRRYGYRRITIKLLVYKLQTSLQAPFDRLRAGRTVNNNIKNQKVKCKSVEALRAGFYLFEGNGGSENCAN